MKSAQNKLSLIGVAAALGGLAMWSFSKHQPSVTALNAAPKAAVLALSHDRSPQNNPPPTPNHKKARPDDDDKREKLDQTLQDNVVVNLGKVEDIGKQTANMMTSRNELRALRAIAPADRTPEQKVRLQELERQQAVALGLLGEISSFQNNPDEYARFFGSMLQQAASLDAGQTSAISNYMRDRATAMVAAGYNTANEPSDPAAAKEWETKRDAFNEATANGVAAILPAGVAAKAGFTPGFLEMMEQDFGDESP